MNKKVVYLVIDGLADTPFNGKTPLSVAKKPNLDYLAKNGVCGQILTVKKKAWDDTARQSITHTATIGLLGYDVSKFPTKRGPMEAVGSDVPYKEGDLALRANFATVDKELKVLDRRAGRNSLGLDEIARYINEHVKLQSDFAFRRTYEHRGVLIIKQKLSDEITTNDPLKKGEKVKKITPLNKGGEISARIVQEFVDQAHNVIEYHPKNSERIDAKIPVANYILVREAGNRLFALMPPFPVKFGLKKAVCISENGATKAACLLSGFQSETVPELPFKETLDFIFDNIEDSLAEYDFVYAHIKGTDEASHDGDFSKKKKMIEEIDKKMEIFKKDFEDILVVTTDHLTSTEKGEHVYGPVPVLVYGKGKKDSVDAFDEISVKKGMIKNFSGLQLLKFVMGR